MFYPFRELEEPSITFEKLISIVDSALYYAKDCGRDAAVKATFIGHHLDLVLLPEEKKQISTTSLL